MDRRKPLSPPISFDRVARVYDETRSLPPELQREVVEHLATHLRGGRSLDVGAGTGRFALPLQRDHGLPVVALDVSARMLGVGRSRGLGEIVRGDARCLPFRDRAFDRTVANHLLHLIPEWETALGEIVRVTRLELLSVLKTETETPSLHDEYAAAAKREGVETAPPGLPERRLATAFPPERREPVGGFEVTLPVATVIDRLRDRCYRDQWEVPPAVHRRVVRSLRAAHAREEVRSSGTLELAIWSIDRLATALAERRSAPGTPVPRSA